jgi:hypothetical protein
MKRTRKNVPAGYDSWFEYDLYNKLKECKYHTEAIDYVIARKYHPDFIFHNGKYKVFIEAKGRFRDRGEARKYTAVKEGLGKYETLVFVFMNPNTPMPGARKRQDGSKQTMAEWADKHKINWYTMDTVPLAWMRKK